MAKLKAPLLSLGAAQQIGKTLVFFSWKGINAVREYVVPSNPKTSAQTTQRGYMTNAVSRIHTAQGRETNPLDADDVTAYQALANLRPTPRTWFNEVVKQMIDQQVNSKGYPIYTNVTLTPGDGEVAVQAYCYYDNPDDAYIYYGTSPTALVNSVEAIVAGSSISKTISSLTNGVKYYFQIRPKSGDGSEGGNSGIYHSTPSA